MSTNPNSEDFDFSAFEEDEKLEWWQPSKRDQYDLTNKLFRVGCRPLQRKYVACKQQGESDFQKCKLIKEELEKCTKLLKFVYGTNN